MHQMVLLCFTACFCSYQTVILQYASKKVPVPNGKGIAELLQYQHGAFAPLLRHFRITAAAFQPAAYLSGSRARDARAPPTADSRAPRMCVKRSLETALHGI